MLIRTNLYANRQNTAGKVSAFLFISWGGHSLREFLDFAIQSVDPSTKFLDVLAETTVSR